MNITLTNATEKEYKEIKPLFLSAFPPEERPPFFIVKNRAKKGAAEMLVVRDGEKFVGFVYLVSNDKLAYLFFLAISEDCRQSGYGSAVLKKLSEMCRGKRLFLAREELDERADNYEERVKRHAFYLKNGFADLGSKLKEASVVYDVMGIGGDVLPEEYDELISRWCGKLARKFIDMRIIK